MLEFDFKVFNELLQTVPAAIPYCEKPQHSDYLQTEVFDRLGRGESIDLSKLDLNAFELCHTSLAWSGDHYESMARGWGKGFNKMLKVIHAAPREKHAFF